MVESLPKLRRVLLTVTSVTLVVFGGLIAGITLQLRANLRTEVLRREAEAIFAVAHMQLSGAQSRPAGEDEMGTLFAAVLESSRLRGVLAVQLFDANGTLREALPP